MDCSIKLSESKNEEKVIEKRFPYREAIGSLNYVALISRPDISYAVNILAQFSNNSSELHCKAVKHVMRYLKGTIKFSLCYSGRTEDELIGYCDSDYVGDLEEIKSTSGYIFMLHGGPIVWSTSLQRVTALSSLEAEYMTISEACEGAIMVATTTRISRSKINKGDCIESR
ncbi:hypothetical protein ACFW04_007412 [Cataglyphis niger]